MKIRVLSILQPWAGFILYGSKTVENRTWRTTHRGPLLIHSSRSSVGLNRGVDDNWFQFAGIIRHNAKSRPEFTTGAILGIANVVGCRPAEPNRPTVWHDFDPERKVYWWELVDAVLFQTPIPMRGQQGFWTVDLIDGTALQSAKWPTLQEYVLANSDKSA